MKKTATLTLVLGAGLVVALAAALWTTRQAAGEQAAQGRVFELRTYVTHPGRLDALNKRFRDHTCRLFKKHGIELVGFWTPADGPESKNTLVYMVAFPSVEAQKKSWAAFREDPEWTTAKAKSEKDGPIVEKIESKNLAATDYSSIR